MLPCLEFDPCADRSAEALHCNAIMLVRAIHDLFLRANQGGADSQILALLTMQVDRFRSMITRIRAIVQRSVEHSRNQQLGFVPGLLSAQAPAGCAGGSRSACLMERAHLGVAVTRIRGL